MIILKIKNLIYILLNVTLRIKLKGIRNKTDLLSGKLIKIIMKMLIGFFNSVDRNWGATACHAASGLIAQLVRAYGQ